VTSAKHKCDFVVEQLKNSTVGAWSLSVSSEGQFLVGEFLDKQLHVYSAEYSHVMSINLCGDDTLADALWTPRGHIMYAANNNKKVVVMTCNGEVITQTNSVSCLRFYVSPDDVIYLAGLDSVVYQSTDDGATWTHVFEVADECLQVIKVSSDSNTQTFWALECKVGDHCNENGNGNDNEDTANDDERDNNELIWRLRMYTVDKRRVSSNNVTWRDINIPSHVTVDLYHVRNWHMTVIQISSSHVPVAKRFTFGRLVDSMCANCCHLSRSKITIPYPQVWL
jgi:hypothetical protein